MNRAGRIWKFAGLCVLASISLGARSSSGQLPSDVRSNHWAASAVGQVLKSGVMAAAEDHQFHGEAHVTRAQAVIALAVMAKKLEAGGWQIGESAPVPDKVSKTLAKKSWQTKPVTRYEFASVMVRFGNYFAKAAIKPAPGATDLGKSEFMPVKPKITIPVSSPAYSSLKYLVDNKMINPTAPLLKADNTPVQASELSRGIAEVAAGVSNKLTELGHDAEGNTPDKSFHPKKPVPRHARS